MDRHLDLSATFLLDRLSETARLLPEAAIPMLKTSIRSQKIRAEERSGWDPDAGPLEPDALIRWLKQLLKTVKVRPPDGESPPDWPADQWVQSGEDDHCHYYYFYCRSSDAPDIDINHHKGHILIRVEKPDE